MEYNIMLIGFMGSGKTTVSRELSKRLGIMEIDIDRYIVENENMDIASIFKEFGEEYFRDKETEALIDIQKTIGTIVSCGGGIVLRDKNIEYMKEKGVIVLLTANPETILERVKYDVNRPILNGNMNVDFISELMDKRKERYLSVADIIIATDNKSISEICKELEDRIQKWETAKSNMYSFRNRL